MAIEATAKTVKQSIKFTYKIYQEKLGAHCKQARPA